MTAVSVGIYTRKYHSGHDITDCTSAPVDFRIPLAARTHTRTHTDTYNTDIVIISTVLPRTGRSLKSPRNYLYNFFTYYYWIIIILSKQHIHNNTRLGRVVNYYYWRVRLRLYIGVCFFLRCLYQKSVTTMMLHYYNIVHLFVICNIIIIHTYFTRCLLVGRCYITTTELSVEHSNII